MHKNKNPFNYLLYLKHILFSIIVFIVAFAINIGAIIFLSYIGGLLVLEKGTLGWFVWFSFAIIFTITLVIVIVWALNRYILKNKFLSLFDKTNIPSFKQSLLWGLFGVILFIALVLVFFFIGILKISFVGTVPLGLALLYAFIVSLFPGIVEEVVYRYFFYGYLKTKIPTLYAILISGILFGAVHLNQVSNISDGIQLIFAAIGVTTLFIAIYEKTGSIWPGAIVHTIWNMLSNEGGIMITNSVENINSYFEYIIIMVSSDNSFISGGSFGVESSLFAVIIYFIAAYFIWKTPVFSKTNENNSHGI